MGSPGLLGWTGFVVGYIRAMLGIMEKKMELLMGDIGFRFWGVLGWMGFRAWKIEWKLL